MRWPWLPSLLAVVVGVPRALAQDETEEHFIDIGAPGDDDAVGPGVYQREGPVEGMGPVFDATFRWCQDRFTLNLPVFPGKSTLVSIRMRPRAGDELLVEAAGRPVAIVRSQGDNRLEFVLPGSVVGDNGIIPVTFRAPAVCGPASERDRRILYGPLDWVRVRPVDTPGLGDGATALSVKIGDPGDEMFLIGGFYGREGPYDTFGDFFRDTFRWAQPGFSLGLPVFPRSANTVILRASISGDDRDVTVVDGDHAVGFLSPTGEDTYTISMSAEQIGERSWIVLTFHPLLPLVSANPQDSRQLFCALNSVTILGEGGGAQVPVLLPPTYSLKVASYQARCLGVSGGSPAITICPRVGFSSDAGAKLPPHLCQEAAVVLANGCSPVLWGQDDVPGAARKAVDAFVRPRRETFIGTTSLPHVAVIEPAVHRLVSGRTAGAAGGAPRALVYAVHFLNQLHYPCDVIPDSTTPEALGRYALVVAPSMAWYADDLWPKLRQYVQAGGALLATGSASLTRNEADELSFALADVYGIAPTGTSVGNGLVPSNGYFASIGTAHVVARTTAEELLPLCSTDQPEKETLEAPGATANRFGKGRAVYVAGPIFAGAAARTDPLAVPVIARALEAAVPEPLVELEGGDDVEIALRARDEFVYVHLANRTESADFGAHPAYIEEVLPIGPMRLKLRMDEQPRSVTCIPGGQQATWEDGVLTVRLPRLELHAVVAIRRG